MQFIIIPTIIATGILSIPSMAAQLAVHDMWMTPIAGSIIGFITVFLAWKLHELFPRMTPIQYNEKILGKILGSMLSFFLIFFYLHNTGLIVQQYTDFITMNVLTETPELIFSLSIMVVSALAVRGGIEVIARSAVICTTIFMLSSLSLLLLIKDMDVSLLLPIMENGITPVLKGGFVFGAWYSELFLLAFIFPFLNREKISVKPGILATIYIMLIFFYVNFFVLTVLGVTAGNQLYPVYSLIRAISVFDFFENFEVIITASWVLGNFVKISMFLYVVSLALAQLLRLSDYRIVVYPISLFIILFSQWGLPNYVVLVDYMKNIQPTYFLLVQVILPLCLLLIALARGMRGRKTN